VSAASERAVQSSRAKAATPASNVRMSSSLVLMYDTLEGSAIDDKSLNELLFDHQAHPTVELAYEEITRTPLPADPGLTDVAGSPSTSVSPDGLLLVGRHEFGDLAQQ
jgi:hypothetical protein